MNKRKLGTRRSKVAIAGFGIVAIAPLTGCDVTDTVLGLAKSAAVDAARDGVNGAITGAVDDLLGGVLPGAGE